MTDGMGRLTFGRLREAWAGEASDFTPLLGEQLDALGEAIGVNLLSVGKTEVASTGGRRIDIVAQDTEGAELVVENQYGRADHDHLTRGLAYAVARQARGLIVVAEEHRDEFRAVAQYLNDLAEHDPDRGIAVWLVEVKAVRIDTSRWAPLFAAVEKPNQFTASVELAKQTSGVGSLEEFLRLVESPSNAEALATIAARWTAAGHILWWPNHTDTYVTLAASGPSKNGRRSVLTLYRDGHVTIPFGAYAGQNTRIAVEALASPEFVSKTRAHFGIPGSSSTPAGWLSPERVDDVLTFALEVADVYRLALTPETVETNDD